MHWKLKATIQNAVSVLPSELSYASYYWLQRRFGALRRFDPMSRLEAGVETWRRIARQGRNPAGKCFLEVGTGRVPLVPLAYWLMGAGRTITIDLNPYLKDELVGDTLRYIANNQETVRAMFDDLLDERRFAALLDVPVDGANATRALLTTCQIEYIAPGDAARTALPSGSVDFHTSYTVFEHIPPANLYGILTEASRVLADNGLLVHRIDYSDHFSHVDPRICAINFLRYSDAEWARYAGNRYMYMNRLRHDDFIKLFQAAGFRIVDAETESDAVSGELVRTGRLPVSKEFTDKSVDILSLTGAWITAAI